MRGDQRVGRMVAAEVSAMSGVEHGAGRPPGEVYADAIAQYNSGDADGFADAHAEGAVLVTPGGTARGRAAVRAYWQRQRTAFPDLRLTVDHLVEQGDLVASEWTWTGTNTGPLTLRDGRRVPPTGRPVQLRGMELAQIRGGQIAAYRIYWDGMSLARQLGLLGDTATS